MIIPLRTSLLLTEEDTLLTLLVYSQIITSYTPQRVNKEVTKKFHSKYNKVWFPEASGIYQNQKPLHFLSLF